MAGKKPEDADGAVAFMSLDEAKIQAKTGDVSFGIVLFQ